VSAACAWRAGCNPKIQPNPTRPQQTAPNQTNLKAFSAALERVAAAAQAMPTPSKALLQGFQFGQNALASTSSNLLGNISKFQSMYSQVFPRVAQMMG